MQPLGTKVYLLKGYSPSDSFCTFFSESVYVVCHPVIPCKQKTVLILASFKTSVLCHSKHTVLFSLFLLPCHSWET